MVYIRLAHLCRSWKHKPSSPPPGHGSQFVQTGWGEPIYFVDLTRIHFPHPKGPLLCSASLKLPLQPLNNFPTSDYCHYWTRTSGRFQSLPEEWWLGICETAASSSVDLLLYRTQLLAFQPTDTGRDIIWLHMYMCVHVCMVIPLNTRKF